MINTIFYFAPSLEEYQSKWDAKEISPRTIVFIPPKDENESGVIYKGGIPYGGNSSDEQVQSDWNEEDIESPSYIKNKPIIDDILDEFSHNAVENRAIASLIFNLQRQINDINARLTNITFSVEPQSVYFGQRKQISISVTSDAVADSIVIYRGIEEIYRVENSETLAYQDIIVPSTMDDIIYRAEITVSGTTITKEATITVSKFPVNLEWSASSCNAKIGDDNEFPILYGGDGLTILYRSSNSNVATINASGNVTLVNEGTCTIYAEFAGDDTHEASSAHYTLNVTAESHLNVFVGHGTDYALAQFTDTNRGISNNMIVSVARNAGDYVFIKVDKRDNVNNLYTYPGPNMEDFEYVVALDSPIVDGEYKYYKTTNRYNAGEIQYKINKV